MFTNNELEGLIEDYFFNGFVFISKYRNNLSNFLNLIEELNSNQSLFEFKHKNVSTSTLCQSKLSKDLLKYLEGILDELNIVELANKITCRKLYQMNFIHFLSQDKTPALPWHRDTNRTFGKIRGYVPSPTKIAIYSSVVDIRSAPMELIPCSHRFDFQNRYIDRIQPHFCLKKYKVTANPGDILIFDSSILHRRAPCLSNTYRSATIYGLNARI